MSQKHPIFCNQGHNKDIIFSTVPIRPAKQLLLSYYLRRVTVWRNTNITKKKGLSKIQKCLSWSCKTIFNVCKSVHHRTVQINRQPYATLFQFIILTFIYSSTCFVRFPARHQELNDCSGPTTNTARLPPRYESKTRGCLCSHWAPDDGWEKTRKKLSCK